MKTRIAIPVEKGQVFAHFGKAKTFKFYDIEDEKLLATELGEVEGSGHDEIGLWLICRGVNAVICGNIGPAAQGILAGAGILALAGVSGSADEAVNQLLAGTLEAVETATCHHDHGGCGGHCSSGCGGCHCGGR